MLERPGSTVLLLAPSHPYVRDGRADAVTDSPDFYVVHYYRAPYDPNS